MIPCTCNLVDLGAIGSAKTALQTPAGSFSQNRLLLSLTPSSSVMSHCRGGVGLRQYRVVRWFLLPEAELRPRQGQCSRQCAAGGPYHPRAGSFSPVRGAYGRRRQKAAGLQIRLDNKSRAADCKSAATYAATTLQRKHKKGCTGEPMQPPELRGPGLEPVPDAEGEAVPSED